MRLALLIPSLVALVPHMLLLLCRVCANHLTVLQSSDMHIGAYIFYFAASITTPLILHSSVARKYSLLELQ